VWSTLAIHAAPVTCISWSDAAHFATADANGRIVVWELPEYPENVIEDACDVVQFDPNNTGWVDVTIDAPLVEPIMSGEDTPFFEPCACEEEIAAFPSVEVLNAKNEQYPTVEAEADYKVASWSLGGDEG
jgi:hypothetical protein